MPFDAEITQKSRDLIVLECARDYMERHGHCRERAFGPAGEVCIYAAIYKASETVDGRFYDASDVDRLMGRDWLEFSNTHQEAEVLARFDEAIARLSNS